MRYHLVRFGAAGGRFDRNHLLTCTIKRRKVIGTDEFPLKFRRMTSPTHTSRLKYASKSEWHHYRTKLQPNTRWMLDFLRTSFLFSALVFPQKSASFSSVLGAFVSRNVRGRKYQPSYRRALPSSEGTLLINHFSSENSNGTVTDSKISQEKSPHD